MADGSLVRRDGGRLLVGGWPRRIMGLSDTGARLVDGWLRGLAVGDSDSQRALARRLMAAAMLHPQLAEDASARGVASASPKRASDKSREDQSNASRDDVTVVVPVFGDAAGLSELLEALAVAVHVEDGGSNDDPMAPRDSWYSAVEVVVVDDASANGGEIAGVARRAGARLVRRAVNGGPAAARNTGLAEVSTPLVVFVDADVTIQPDALRRLIGCFDDPTVVAVAPRVVSQPGATLLESYESAYSPLDMGAEPSPVGPDRRVRYVPGAALAVRTDTARAVGGFDETMRWGEDVDFVWRLAALPDATVRYEPAAVAHHRTRGSWGAWSRQRRRYGASAASLARQHGSVVAPVRCAPSVYFAWASLALGHPQAAAVTAAVSTGGLADRLGSVTDQSRIERLKLAARLVLSSHLHAALSLARAVTRAWFPLALVAAAFSRRLRPVLATAAVAPAVIDWCRGRRPAGLAATVGLRLADDLSYCTGVWQGVASQRSLTAITPAAATREPGRRGPPNI